MDVTGHDSPARRSAAELLRPRRRRHERGQAMVELALSAPILIMLLMGLIEFGHGLNAYLTVVNSARDAARLGAQKGAGQTALLENLVDGEMARLDNSDLSLSCGSGPSICITSGTVSGSNPVDNWIQVRVCYNHDMIVGIPWVMDGPILMCSQTKIRVAV
jgi:Flp pilus assembly protein TadG